MLLIIHLFKSRHSTSGSPGGSDGKEPACNTGELEWEDPLEKGTLPTPVFWPGEFHGQRSLAGSSPWGCKEWDTTERFSLFPHIQNGSLSYFFSSFSSNFILPEFPGPPCIK